MTLEDFKKLAQAVRPSGHQEEVAEDDLLKQLALCAALLVGPGPQLLQEPSVDLGSLLLGHLYASRPQKVLASTLLAKVATLVATSAVQRFDLPGGAMTRELHLESWSPLVGALLSAYIAETRLAIDADGSPATAAASQRALGEG